MCVFALPTWPGGADNTRHEGKERGGEAPWHFLWHCLFPLFVANRKWHSSSSAFWPPYHHSLSVFCLVPLVFLLCADCDELDGTVGGWKGRWWDVWVYECVFMSWLHVKSFLEISQIFHRGKDEAFVVNHRRKKFCHQRSDTDNLWGKTTLVLLISVVVLKIHVEIWVSDSHL